MRTIAAAAVCFVVTLSAGAQQEKSNALHFFVANPSFSSSDQAGSSYHGTVGLAYSHRLAQRWAAELTIARTEDSASYRRYDHNGNVIESGSSSWHTTPVDLAAFYQFPTGTNWKPYLGAAIRYVDAPPNAVDTSRVAYGVNGGVVWQFHHSLGVRFDGKVLASSGSPVWIDSFNAGVGVVWRF